VPSGEDRSSARRKEGPRLGLQGRGSVQELGGGGAPYVLGSGRGRGSSVPRVEEEGSSELDASLRTVLGSRRGRGVAALAAAALLGSRRRRHSAGDKGATAGSGARRRRGAARGGGRN